jgi:hypothetical protein
MSERFEREYTPPPGDEDLNTLFTALVEGGKSTRNFEDKILRLRLDLEALTLRYELAMNSKDLVSLYGVWFLATTLADRYRQMAQNVKLPKHMKENFEELRVLYKKLALAASANGFLISGYTFSGDPKSDLRDIKS